MSNFVSVIIPNFNHAAFLDKRIESVLNQTYQDFEVIILDDKSTDNSVEVISKYKYDSHISQIIINDQNSGSPFIQWKRGIEYSKGELIWIAESDDYCEPSFLAKLVDAYNKTKGCVLSYCKSKYVDENGKILSKEIEDGKYLSFSGKSFLRKFMIYANPIVNASSVVFSKSAYLNVSDSYQTFKGAGDYMFWAEIIKNGNVSYINQSLSYFRRHSGVVTSRRTIDGTNSFEEKMVLESICNSIRVSRIRLFSAFAFHRYRLNNRYYSFSTLEVEKKVNECWKNKGLPNFKDDIILDFLLNNRIFRVIMSPYINGIEKCAIIKGIDRLRVKLALGAKIKKIIDR